MGKALGVVVGLLVGVSGCTSVKVVQREDCWVRRTEKWYGAVNEELGPCARPQPAWVADRHTRLVQECVAQADYRWQTKALEAFSRGQPWPEQTGQEEVLQLCMNEAARAYIVENDELKTRLAEVKAEQEGLKAALAENDAFLKTSHEKLATSLGEAAQKPPGTATATATASSDGKASTEATDTKTETSSSTPVAPAITWVTTQGGPACGQPQLDQADAAKQTAAADSVKRKSKPRVVKTDTATQPAPMCAPAETPTPTPEAAAAAPKEKVAEVLPPAEKAEPAAAPSP